MIHFQILIFTNLSKRFFLTVLDKAGLQALTGLVFRMFQQFYFSDHYLFFGHLIITYEHPKAIDIPEILLAGSIAFFLTT
jgi:hypothetical protein